MQWTTRDAGAPVVFYGTQSGKLLQVSCLHPQPAATTIALHCPVLPVLMAPACMSGGGRDLWVLVADGKLDVLGYVTWVGC